MVELLIALANASRCSELPRGENTRGVGTAGRSLPIARSVWKIKGVSIRNSGVLELAPAVRRRPRWVALAAVAAIVGAVVLAALIGRDRARAPAPIDAPVTTTLATAPPTTSAPPTTLSIVTPRHGKEGRGNGNGKGENGD